MKVQYRRLMFIDQKLRDGTRLGRYPNCRTLAEEWEVSPKTIMRDIDYMKNQMDAPIEYDQYRHGYFYTEPDYKMPALNIRRSDLFAIWVAEKVLRQYENTPIYDNLVSVFDKLAESMPEKVSVDPTWLQHRFTFLAEPAPRLDADVWRVVFEGLRQSRRLKFRYRLPGRSKVHWREVDPYHAVSYRAEWYLAGHCHYKHSVRTFAFSRMEAVEMTDEWFFIPDDFDYQELAGDSFGIIAGDDSYEVKVRFAPQLAPYAGEREWHPTQQSRVQPDGSLVLKFTTSHLLEVMRWVLSWGAGATVLGPDELKEMVSRELEGALLSYRS